MKDSSIYITGNFVRFVQAVKSRKADFQEYHLDISSLNKEDVPGRLMMFFKQNKLSVDNLILYLPRSKVAIRNLSFPSVDDREIKRMVEFELHNFFPYKQEELVFEATVIERNPDGYSQVMLAALKREIVESELSLLKQAELFPDRIEVSTISLFNQFLQQEKEPANCLLINLEDDLLDIIFIFKGKLSFSRGMSLGRGEGAKNIVKQVKDIVDIQKIKGISVDKILLSGRGVDLGELTQALKEVSSAEVKVNDLTCVTRGITTTPKPNNLKIDLLPEEHRFHKITTKRRRSILYLITLLLLNASLIANISFLKLKEKREYVHLLKSEIGKIESDSILLEKSILKIQILKSYLNSGRITLGLLTELYRIAPSEVYITSLDVSGQSPSGVLVLTGQAEDTRAVLRFASLIKDSVLIQDSDVKYIKKRRVHSREVVDFEIHSSF